MAKNKITAKEAHHLYSSGDPVVFVDSRNPKAWGTSDVKLPRAIRVPADDVESHINEIDRNATVVTYCT
jgi:rhodanese-related sulfurtransferase